MGLQKGSRKVVISLEGIEELETHIDHLETKVDDMITLVSALSKEIAELKRAKKPAPKKTAPKKKAVK